MFNKGFINHNPNKTENAFSPFPARTKASNADMTACLPLQDCIVQTHFRRPQAMLNKGSLMIIIVYGSILPPFPNNWHKSSAAMADSCLISLKWRVQHQLLFTLNGLAQSTVKTE
jgi:hypothetical protein